MQHHDIEQRLQSVDYSLAVLTSERTAAMRCNPGPGLHADPGKNDADLKIALLSEERTRLVALLGNRP